MPLRVKKMMREEESKIQSGACPSALSNELAAPSSAPTQTTNPDEREIKIQSCPCASKK